MIEPKSQWLLREYATSLYANLPTSLPLMIVSSESLQTIEYWLLIQTSWTAPLATLCSRCGLIVGAHPGAPGPRSRPCPCFLSSLLPPFPGEYHWVVGCYKFRMRLALNASSSARKLTQNTWELHVRRTFPHGEEGSGCGFRGYGYLSFVVLQLSLLLNTCHITHTLH